MNLPLYWRRASFSVSDVAELIGAPETQLRTWLARAPFIDFLGLRGEKRIQFSAQDAFFYRLVRDLVAFGVPFRTAMFAAREYAESADESLPNEYLVVRTSDQTTTFDLTYEPNFEEASTLVIPMHRLATDLIERAADIAVQNSGHATAKTWSPAEIDTLGKAAVERAHRHRVFI